MAKRMPKIGGVFLQAESEIAAVNMVLGAAAAGKRAMTSSSSPGISLKSEGLSYIAGVRPALRWSSTSSAAARAWAASSPPSRIISRPPRAAATATMRMIVLAPASVQEMASLTVKGFDLADQYRMTAMILADGTMGQMMEPVEMPEAATQDFDKQLGCHRHEDAAHPQYHQLPVLEAGAAGAAEL